MINLEQWKEVTTNDASSNVTIFSNLRCLKVNKCPELLNISKVFHENDVQHLESLTVSLCNKLTKLPKGLHFSSSIRRVKIDYCLNLRVDVRNKSELLFKH